jgi:hypothetical protein
MSRSSENRFNAVFTPDRLDRIRQHLDGIRAELADTLELTEEDIKEYYKTAEEEVKMMRDIYALADKNRQFAPATFRPEEIIKDIEGGAVLRSLENELQKIAVRCQRNRIVAYSEAYTGCGRFRKFVELAVKDRQTGAVEVLEKINESNKRT